MHKNIPPPEQIVVSTKGQIVIPQGIRQIVGLAAGSKLVIQLRDDGVLEIRLVKGGIEDLFGMAAKFPDSPKKIRMTKDDEKDAIATMVAKEDSKTRKRGGA